MPEPMPHQPSPVWASELVGAQVVTGQGFGGVVAGLVFVPSEGVLAFKVSLPGVAEPPRSADDTLLLPFDAVEAIGSGQVRVLSADDVVPAFKLPSLLAHLTSACAANVGLPVRSATGQSVGYLWDALIDVCSGRLLEYLIGPKPSPQDGQRGVVTSCPLHRCLIGEFTIQHADAVQLGHLLEAMNAQDQAAHAPSQTHLLIKEF